MTLEYGKGHRKWSEPCRAKRVIPSYKVRHLSHLWCPTKSQLRATPNGQPNTDHYIRRLFHASPKLLWLSTPVVSVGPKTLHRFGSPLTTMGLAHLYHKNKIFFLLRSVRVVTYSAGCVCNLHPLPSLWCESGSHGTARSTYTPPDGACTETGSSVHWGESFFVT